MSRTSKNTFNISGETISISRPEWDFIAFATIREDYVDEIQSVTWGLNGDRYLYNAKLGYLHLYIMEKWYGEELCQKMKNADFVVDHMDNDSVNCCIENLCFLSNSHNKAKGLTFDQENKDKSFIALSMFKDFKTDLIQITIVFNYPATLVCEGFDHPAAIEIAYLLYDLDYQQVWLEAEAILQDYKQNYSFKPEKLRAIDYHIEGCIGKVLPPEVHEEYLNGKHGHGVMFFHKIAPLSNWTKDSPQKYFRLDDIKNNQHYMLQLSTIGN